MAKHLGLFLDADDTKTIIEVLNAHRKDLDRHMRKNERKGFSPEIGRADLNVVRHTAICRALKNLSTQIRNGETKK